MCYKTILYGAVIYAGRIRGLNEFKKKINTLEGKEIIVFATGGAPCTEKVIASIHKKYAHISVDIYGKAPPP